MFKSIKIVFLVIVGTVFLLGTSAVEAPDVFNISVEAQPGGDGVKIEWSEIPPYSSGCWGKSEEWLYALYVDGVLVADSLEEPEYDLYTYGQEIVVFGFCSAGETDGIRISVAPIAVVTLSVWELNGTGKSGIGFVVFGEWISTYMMSDSTNRDKIDCYFTDFNQGYQGPYSLASADQVIYDLGYSGSTTGWRETLISEALDVSDIKDVEIVPAQGYANAADSVEAGNTYAILTQDGYYGLIQVIEIDETDGEIEIKATFQPIKGLRWM